MTINPKDYKFRKWSLSPNFVISTMVATIAVMVVMVNGPIPFFRNLTFLESWNIGFGFWGILMFIAWIIQRNTSRNIDIAGIFPNAEEANRYVALSLFYSAGLDATPTGIQGLYAYSKTLLSPTVYVCADGNSLTLHGPKMVVNRVVKSIEKLKNT